MPLSLVGTIASFTFIAGCLASILLYDAIVRLERKNHNAFWVLDGSPKPVFALPGDSSFQQSVLRTKLALMWLLSSPIWARNDKKAKALFISFRIAWFIALLAWLVSAQVMFKKFNA